MANRPEASAAARAWTWSPLQKLDGGPGRRTARDDALAVRLDPDEVEGRNDGGILGRGCGDASLGAPGLAAACWLGFGWPGAG